MSNKNKHLTFDERVEIQDSLDKNISIHQIAKKLCRPDSTINREVQRNRTRVIEGGKPTFTCMHMANCHVVRWCGDQNCRKESCAYCYEICNTPKCPEYEIEQCPKLLKSPFVCNGCPKNRVSGSTCRFPKYRYHAKKAQLDYEQKLTSSRDGISLTPSDMRQIDDIVSPRLLNGQSVRAVYMDQKAALPCCERTLYNYVE